MQADPTDGPDPDAGRGARRPHTGRRRNEAARRAILDAALELLAQHGGAAVTVDTIAAAAGVGKQTIYRWWPSKGAVLLEAMTERARGYAPAPDAGTLRGDLEVFLAATFRSAGDAEIAPLLRTVMAEAQRDPHAAEVLRNFTSERRHELGGLLARGRDRGELPPEADLDLIVDQAYGLLWYRIMLDHAPLTADVATRLANALLAQAQASR